MVERREWREFFFSFYEFIALGILLALKKTVFSSWYYEDLLDLNTF